MFGWVKELIAVIIALVTIVERPGDGEAKRNEVIDLVLEKVGEHVALPAWAKSVFLRRSFIGWLVDVIVWAANTTGFFGDTESQESGS